MSTIVATYLSRKPYKYAMAVNSLVVGAMGILTVLAWQNENLKKLWSANRELAIDQLQFHRLVLSIFLHSDPAHFLSNAYMFAILGFLICGYFGARVYFGMIFGLGTLIHYLSLLTYEPQVNLFGISGIVYLFAGFWLVLYVGIDRRHSLGARLVRAIGVGLVVLFPSTMEPQVSYRAHAIGFGVGLLFGMFYFLRWRGYFRKFEVEAPEESILEPSENRSTTWH